LPVRRRWQLGAVPQRGRAHGYPGTCSPKVPIEHLVVRGVNCQGISGDYGRLSATVGHVSLDRWG